MRLLLGAAACLAVLLGAGVAHAQKPPRVGVLHLERTQAAARKLGMQVVPAEARTPADPDRAMETLAGARLSALMVLPDGMIYANRARACPTSSAAPRRTSTRS